MAVWLMFQEMASQPGWRLPEGAEMRSAALKNPLIDVGVKGGTDMLGELPKSAPAVGLPP